MENSRFGLVREYLLTRMGITELNDKLTLIESERRLRCELSYGYVHLIWITGFDDGRIAVSLPPGIANDVKTYIRDNAVYNDIASKSFMSPLHELADRETKRLLGKNSCKCFTDLVFACDSESIKPPNPGVTAQRITDTRYECNADIWFPDHCLPDGVVYGVLENNKIVSLAYAHKTGEYQDTVADVGTVTSKEFRKKGYARECVNSVARHFIENKGESVYKCSPTNTASVSTALSAGYITYGKSLIFSVSS